MMHFYLAHGRLFLQINRFPVWFSRVPLFTHRFCRIGDGIIPESKLGRFSIIATGERT